jgi:hypothetical protein
MGRVVKHDRGGCEISFLEYIYIYIYIYTLLFDEWSRMVEEGESGGWAGGWEAEREAENGRR